MVRWTTHARTQLHHIHDHIAQDSLLYARRVTEELVQKTVGLSELPRIGRKVPELNEVSVRELNHYSCRIIYEINSGSHIDILAVIHKRQHTEPKGIQRDT